jgi:hypothetical protein
VSSPYIEQGNICVVPVLRHRLNFAVQVQRVACDIGLGGQDLVAVALPESVRKPVLEAVATLPRVSLVISSVSDSDQREVFPVTPADGIVEAVRLATERQIQLRFVDQEVAPGHLVDHFCLSDEDWPDDGLALERGAEAYLSLIGKRLVHPPARYEPVDSWRELHMAAQLQGLASRYRRVLFVCNATHVDPLRRLMRRPVPLADADRTQLPRRDYKIRQPSLPILMRYLDHIPRLVEAYERQRAQGKAHLFDKRSAVLEIMHELSDESTDLNLSIRHYQAFSQILARLLEGERRMSPDFETVLWALESCFPPVFRERAYRHLLGYFDQVKAERIGRIRGSKEPVFQVNTTAQGNSRNIYVARNCTQLDHYYEFVNLPGESSSGESSDVPDIAPDMSPSAIVELDPPLPPRGTVGRSAAWTESWPPADAFTIDMRRKAFRLARRRGAKRAKSLAFRGSLHDGVDFRRTLRSYYRSQPQLYVKQEMRVRTDVFDLDEPVLWLFDGYDSVDLNSTANQPEPATAGPQDQRRAVEWYVLDKSRNAVVLEDRLGAPVKIRLDAVHALLSFMDWDFTRPTEEIFRSLGSQLDRRVPLSATLEDVEWLCADLSEQYRLDLTMARWWEVLLTVALRYAKDSVVLVAPQKFVVPDAIARQFAAERKSIARLSMTGFTGDELRRLQVQPWLEHPYEPLGDSSAPGHLAFVADHFGDLMKRFWT